MLSSQTRLKFLIPITVILSFLACTGPNQKTLPAYHSSTSLSSPVEFADGIRTLNGISFSGARDELYISLQLPDTFDNGRHKAGIFKLQFQSTNWTEPELLEIEGISDAYHPVISPDGQRLFFNSRSHPDSGGAYLKHDLWYLEKEINGWSQPNNIPAVNTVNYESYPSVASNRNLYFNSDRPGGKGGMDFYVSRFHDGKYLQPMALTVLNSTDEENDLVVDPKERFIIFNRYAHADQSIDLWVSFRSEGVWLAPKKLESINEEEVWELTPTLAPDGKYFFFEKNSMIWQMDLEILLKSARQ